MPRRSGYTCRHEALKQASLTLVESNLPSFVLAVVTESCWVHFTWRFRVIILVV